MDGSTVKLDRPAAGRSVAISRAQEYLVRVARVIRCSFLAALDSGS